MNVEIHHHIYKNLIKLIPELCSLKAGIALNSCREGWMDLSLDVLEKDAYSMKIALSHHYKHQSGDMMPIPNMEIKVLYRVKSAKALTYQMDFIHEHVYPDEKHFYSCHKKSLNGFLNGWLKNCLSQGHTLKQTSFFEKMLGYLD